MPSFDFWFDYSCPYAYAASAAVKGVAARTGATVRYRPFLLGGVFRAVGTAQNLATTLSPQKALHLLHDQQRATVSVGLPFAFPAEHPRRTVLALRATLAAARLGDPTELVEAYFRAYWAEGRALEDEAVVRMIAAASGFPALDLEPERESLRVQTDTAIGLGVFGAPAFTVGEQLFWGYDRLPMVERALGGKPVAREALEPPDAAAVDFWFDYSSPFAYLASTQIPALAARTGVEVRWRPFLLGAVFKALGQADVPLFAFPDAKRQWYLRDIGNWAEHWGVPFVFSPHFPMRTVLALRCTLMHPEPVAFAQRVFAAAWGQGRDIGDPSVLTDLGGQPELAEQAKSALFEQTALAQAAGVFGTPTFIVHAHGAQFRFWGQDRLDQVEDTVCGWVPPGAL